MATAQTESASRVATRSSSFNGEGGIRTLGGVAATPVFETGPIGRSGTSPAISQGHEARPGPPSKGILAAQPPRDNQAAAHFVAAACIRLEDDSRLPYNSVAPPAQRCQVPSSAEEGTCHSMAAVVERFGDAPTADP